jgi:hypothetical protein
VVSFHLVSSLLSPCEMFCNTVTFCGKELLSPRPTFKLEETPLQLSTATYSEYPPYLQVVPPLATCGRAMLWWQGPIYHGNFHTKDNIKVGYVLRKWCANMQTALFWFVTGSSEYCYTIL